MKVYCVFVEHIINMCYEVDFLDKIFATRESAEKYIKDCNDNNTYNYTIEEEVLNE